MEVLERTSVFVTYSGANSLMDAFHLSVPVVVIPQMAEQPLNAQRVAELGLGLALDKKTVTVEQLRQAVDRVSSEPAFREKVRTVVSEGEVALTSVMGRSRLRSPLEYAALPDKLSG